MAGDWIKVEAVTPDKPEIFRIADALQIDPDAVTGKLIRIWIWADQQTIDGNARGVTRLLLDRISGVDGFATAMEAVGWIADTGNGLAFVNFDRHNGKTAKKRALTNKRVAAHRANRNAESNAERNAPSVTKTFPEKKREEGNPPVVPPGDDSLANDRRRGSRLPDDWALPSEWRKWTEEHTPQVNPAREAEKFRDFWHGTVGTKGRKADWFATWRNWCRRAAEHLPAGTKASADHDFWKEVQ